MDAQRLALIEIVERDGRVRQQADVRQWPVRIGRALDCDIVIEDPHVAAHHATLAPDADGRLWLEIGDTRNGVRVGRRTLPAGARVALDGLTDALHFGFTRLRVRRAGDPLPPELPMAALAGPGTVLTTLGLTLALWAVFLVEHWLVSDPDTSLNTWLPVLLGVPGALVLWCAAWATASKLFVHRFEFGAHWGHAVRWLLVVLIAGTGLTLLAATVGSPTLFAIVGVAELALVGAWLFGHARIVLPMHARALTLSVSAALVVGVGVMVALNHQNERPWVGPLYMHVLPPHPTVRVERPQTPEIFVQRAEGLRDTLDRRAKDDDAAEEDDAPPEGS